MALLHSFVYADKRANIRIPLFALAESCLRRCDVGKRYLSVFAFIVTIYTYIYDIYIYTYIYERKREKIVIALDTKNENEAFQLFQIIPIQIVEVIGGRIAAKYFHVKSTNSTPCCETISSQRCRFAI